MHRVMDKAAKLRRQCEVKEWPGLRVAISYEAALRVCFDLDPEGGASRRWDQGRRRADGRRSAPAVPHEQGPRVEQVGCLFFFFFFCFFFFFFLFFFFMQVALDTSPMARMGPSPVGGKLITARTGRQVETRRATLSADVTQPNIGRHRRTGVFASALAGKPPCTGEREPGRALRSRTFPRRRCPASSYAAVTPGRTQGRTGGQGRAQAGRPAPPAR